MLPGAGIQREHLRFRLARILKKAAPSPWTWPFSCARFQTQKPIVLRPQAADGGPLGADGSPSPRPDFYAHFHMHPSLPDTRIADLLPPHSILRCASVCGHVQPPPFAARSLSQQGCSSSSLCASTFWPNNPSPSQRLLARARFPVSMRPRHQALHRKLRSQ
jgi:hypothetical protein